MTWLGHENLCPIAWGQPCDCRLPGEDPCTCSPVSGLNPECPLHGGAPTIQAELDRLEREDPAVAKASAGLDAVYRNVGGGLPPAQIRDIYDLDRPYETLLDEDERRGH